MLKPHLFLLCATTLLGSCVPMPTQPSVTIYNTYRTGDPKAPHTSTIKCGNGNTYTLPDKPDLSALSDDDDAGVVDLLNTHIDQLRAELRTLAAKGVCSS